MLSDAGDDVDVGYAEVALAMERAFVSVVERRPELTREELFVALLLLKDRILEQHIPAEALSPDLASVARKLYAI